MNPPSASSPKGSSVLLPRSSAEFGAYCETGVKISGYHMESLAIDAFAGYEGELDPKSMLMHFLGHSMNAVRTPIEDPTGQTTYVDGYLGQGGSPARKGASTHFGQMRGKVNSCGTRAEFDELFCKAI